jgi:hypothetical protein
MLNCVYCKAKLVQGAAYCHQCGRGVGTQAHVGRRVGMLNMEDKGTLALQLKSLFPKFLEERLALQGDGARCEVYMGRYYSTDFDLVVRRRCEEVGEKMGTEGDVLRLERWIEGVFEDLFCEFVVVYCSDLGGIALSPGILEYAGAGWGGGEDIHLGHLVAAYLEPHLEAMEIYTNLVQMPAGVLRNALKSYLQVGSAERVLAVCNQTIWINPGSEGFGLTTAGVYWRSPLSKAQKVLYSDIVELKMDKWLLINDLYFNVNERINFKMLYLLRKLANMI